MTIIKAGNGEEYCEWSKKPDKFFPDADFLHAYVAITRSILIFIVFHYRPENQNKLQGKKFF